MFSDTFYLSIDFYDFILINEITCWLALLDASQDSCHGKKNLIFFVFFISK